MKSMITLSDILSVVNSSLELERKQRNLEAKGHFSLKEYTSAVEEGMALNAIVTFFIDADHQYPVIRVHHVVDKRIWDKNVEENHKFDMMILDNLWKLLKFGQDEFAYEKFVDGTFNYINIVE